MLPTLSLRPRSVRTTSRAAAAAGLVGVLTLLTQSGCYTHVVRASGPGADQYEIHEPEMANTVADRALFGDTRSTRTGSLIKDRPNTSK